MPDHPIYSLVVPVYNRPDEIQVLLECLEKQTFQSFEVIVVESGSPIRSDKVVESFAGKLDVKYVLTGNFGQGFSRNTGFKEAKGDYFIVLDSDILLDPDFVFNIDKGIKEQQLDAHGGPDRCHDSFSDIEKAINYTLTSFFTTGGTRGNKKRVGTYYPRSFNMGFSRKVYEATGGFKLPFMGEDIELSSRIIALGFKTGLIEDAYVYHHRKTSFRAFFRQMNFFGKARVNILKHVPGSLKLIHLVPLLFTAYLALLPVLLVCNLFWYFLAKIPLYLFILLIFIDSTRKNHSVNIGFLSVIAVFVQMTGYGIGFAGAYWNRVVMGNDSKELRNI